MPIFCTQCGVSNPNGARYCDQCGAMLVQVPTQTPPPPSVPAVPMPAAGGLTCAQCGTPAIAGEAFCDNCGAPLGNIPRAVPPQPVYPPPQPSTDAPAGRLDPAGRLAPAAPTSPPPSYAPPARTDAPAGRLDPAPPSYAPAGRLDPAPPSYAPPAAQPTPMRQTLAPAYLMITTTGVKLALPNSGQASVGRGDSVSNFFPDVDLGPYGAIDNGVGRRHLRLFVQQGRVYAEDQDSTNGSKINGQPLPARQPRPLNNGDLVTLGKLDLTFFEI